MELTNITVDWHPTQALAGPDQESQPLRSLVPNKYRQYGAFLTHTLRHRRRLTVLNYLGDTKLRTTIE
jgi:hypothetical protein